MRKQTKLRKLTALLMTAAMLLSMFTLTSYATDGTGTDSGNTDVGGEDTDTGSGGTDTGGTSGAEGDGIPVSYLVPVYENGEIKFDENNDVVFETKTVTDYTVAENIAHTSTITSPEQMPTIGTSDEATWYVANSDVVWENFVLVQGDVHLIICDDVTITSRRGIIVSTGNSLTIYGQESGTGALTAKGANYLSDFFSAAIGGCDITTELTTSGSITINGGKITATGTMQGAAIGGSDRGAGGTITINGGTVDAKGSNNASAIGGGYGGNSGVITINGGNVTATKGTNGSAIGAGAVDYDSEDESNCVLAKADTISINGGTVVANITSSSSSADPAIGGRFGFDEINISGGHITINHGRSDEIGIGTESLYVMEFDGNINISGGTIVSGSDYDLLIGSQSSSTDPKGTVNVVVTGGNINGTFKNTESLTDDGKNPVQKKEFALTGAADKTPVTAIDGYPTYGLTDVVTDDDKLVIYVPELKDSASVTAGGKTYEKTEDDTYRVAGETILFFDANGGTGTTSPMAFVGDETKTLPDSTFEKQYYNFTGWNTLADGSGTPYEVGAEFSITEDTTLYAQWEQITYTVTYNANGGTGEMGNGIAYASSSKNFTLPECDFTAPAEKVFKGWTIGTSSTVRASGYETKITADTTVTAQWTDPVLEVTVDGQTTQHASWDDIIPIVEDKTAYVKILSDHSISESYNVYAQKLTVDLNGCTISRGNYHLNLYYDVEITGTGTIKGSYPLLVNETVTMKIGSGVTIQTTNATRNGISVYDGATLILNGGTITLPDGSTGYHVSSNDSGVVVVNADGVASIFNAPNVYYNVTPATPPTNSYTSGNIWFRITNSVPAETATIAYTANTSEYDGNTYGLSGAEVTLTATGAVNKLMANEAEVTLADGVFSFTMPSALVTLTAEAGTSYPEGTIIIPLDENGIPASDSGTGWTYDTTTNTLTLTNGYSYAVDGECEVIVNNSGTIVGGTYNNTVNNVGDGDTTWKEEFGVIDGGIFNGDVNNADGLDICTINGGTFNGKVTNKNRGVVNDGTFYGEFDKLTGSTVNGGTFAVSFVVNGGTWANGYTVPTTYTYANGLVLPTSENISNGTLSFDGWYENADFSGLPVTEIAAGSYGKLTFYARFIDGIATWEIAGDKAVENTDYTVDADGNYTVLTAKGLAKIANIVNGGDNLSAKTVMLANNIDLLDGGVYGYGKDTVTERNSWLPIDGFAGTFDGNGKKIDNLYLLTTNKDAGLFGSNTGTIKNLEIASGKVTINVSSGSELHAGGIAASTSGLIYNCVNRAEIYSNDTSGSGSVYIGGITGLVSTSTGGAEVSTISNCTNYGKVSNLGSSSCGISGGGIAGYHFSGRITGRKTLITRCVNEGVISVEPGTGGWAGGIAGTVKSNSNSNTSISATVTNCVNSASVGSNMAGGITGYNTNAAYVYNCYNTGSITGNTNAGGIVGLNYNSNATVANCYSTGTVSDATNVGGIVGRIPSGIMKNCYYLSSAAPAVFGYKATNAIVENCVEFSSYNGTHTLSSEVYETTDLLTALKAWVSEINSSDYMDWTADELNDNYPVLTEYAVKYTITFNSNGGTETAAITQAAGTAVTKPQNPTKDGCTFKGWDAEIPETMPNENVTITAQWYINEVSLTFTEPEVNATATEMSAPDGALYTAETLWDGIDVGETFTTETLYSLAVTVEPAENHFFSSDTAVSVNGNEFDGAEINETQICIEKDYTFNAAPASYTVTVTSDGNGTASASVASGVTGTEVTLTAVPTGGYEFKEWQVVSGGVTVSDNKFNIGTANVEIKAVFEKYETAEITVKLVREEGIKPYAVTYEDGTTYSSLGRIAILQNGGEVYTVDETVNTDTAALKATAKLIPGKYTLKVTKPGYVSYESEIEITADSQNSITINLIPGDIRGSYDTLTGDGVVDIDDFIRVIRGFDSDASSPKLRNSVDINEDKVVNVTDLGYIKRNFGKASESYNG